MESEELTDWRSLVHQAYQVDPLRPNSQATSGIKGNFKIPTTEVLFTRNRRDREPSSHFCSHDLQLKRFLGLALIDAPLPVLLKSCKGRMQLSIRITRALGKEGVLCMGFLRAH